MAFQSNAAVAAALCGGTSGQFPMGHGLGRSLGGAAAARRKHASVPKGATKSARNANHNHADRAGVAFHDRLAPEGLHAPNVTSPLFIPDRFSTARRAPRRSSQCPPAFYLVYLPLPCPSGLASPSSQEISHVSRDMAGGSDGGDHHISGGTQRPPGNNGGRKLTFFGCTTSSPSNEPIVV
jgi:hypothetical protein